LEKLKKSLSFIGDVAFNAVVILIVVVLVRYILISPFQVNGSSMDPTLHNNDLLIVDKITYRFGEPERGDIIVFAPPEDTDIFFVKRIVGLPGETVEFNNGQVLIRNEEYPAGFKLDESYLVGDNQETHLPSRDNQNFTVPENHYFVMGDNRNASNDSRRCFAAEGCTEGKSPFLHRANIEGRARLILWPFGDMTVLREPDYAL
jgi:signal peptidase I